MKNVALIHSLQNHQTDKLSGLLRTTELFEEIRYCKDLDQMSTALKGPIDVIFCGYPERSCDLSDLLALLETEDKWQDIPLLLVAPDSRQHFRIQALEFGACDSLSPDLPCHEAAIQIDWHLKNKRRIEQLQAAKAVFAHRAITDGLTGLYNRSYFDADLEQKLTLVQRTGRPLTLLLADLDHFKRVNDTHGHLAGDQALQAFADLLRKTARKSDSVCRYGGEEFAVILPECDSTQAFQAAERLRQRVSEHDFGFPLTVSIGLAPISTKCPGTVEQLLQCADSALYEAKKQGRNRTIIYSGHPVCTVAAPPRASYRTSRRNQSLLLSLRRSIAMLRKAVRYSFT